MLTDLGRRTAFIALVFFLSYVASLRQYGTSSGSLYVADDRLERGQKYSLINRFDEENYSSHLERRKREADAPSVPAPAAQKNISTWTTHLNDSHQQLMVHWVGEGSNVIICLARDSVPRGKGGIAPSALYISYDYGKNFTNKTESFRLGDEPDSGYAQLDKFFNHPKYPEFCVFVDSINKKLYYTSDNGQNIHRSDLTFHPSELAFDEEFPGRFVILDKVGSNRMLYLTLDGGKTFTLIQDYVKSFFWSSGPGFAKIFYVERWKPDRTSTVFSANDPSDLHNANVLFEDAKDFQIKGDFMFATRDSKEKNTLHLYISHQRGPFYKAEFQTELDLKKFHVADVTEQRIFVSVMHTNTLANLYVSEINNNFSQYNFVPSLEQILCYFPDGNWKDSWLEDVTEDPFTDLYRVEGLKGIYIASRIGAKTRGGTIGPEHLVSEITFDHGVTWSPINPPTEDENGQPLNCQVENQCSLHLCQKFSQLYPVSRSASIMSSKSAPGVIMATGVMGKSLKGIPGVYLSRDAGLTWKRILKDYYFFNYGDHGGVLAAVKYFKSRGETRRILYSTNEGIEWNSYQFNANDLRIYGLMTEPGENTTTFTMFGSANDQHQWIIITIDLRNTFERNCTPDDYKFWSPSPNSSVSCVLGVRETFQRRIAHSNCYNGIDYDRPVKKETCQCSRRDYECDFGFMRSGIECIRNKSVNIDPFAIPGDCAPGKWYKRTKGYRKIDGDTCSVGAYIPYSHDNVPCPLDDPQEFLIVALRDKVARIDLSNNATLIPITEQKNIVAIEYDMKNSCLYWADIDFDKISRLCFEHGTTEEVIVDTDLASIEGMALDWMSNVLFFVDGSRKKIEAVRTDLTNKGRMRVTILNSTVLSKPRGIAVHPKRGYLFWTDWDRNFPSVSRSNLDGKNVKKLFEKPIVQWPNGITIDQMSERIYWVDAMEDYIASADMEGQHFKRILWNDERVTHPFAVAVLKDKMYWDDWKAKSIFMADKDTGLDVVTINDAFTGLMDLKVFAHFVQHGENACSDAHNSCDALCLGSPNGEYSCLCPDGFIMTNKKCVCPNGVEPLANMTCPRKPGSTCGPSQFTCKSGLCIEASWRCDGNNDCGDMSDEIGCLCSPPMISCDDTQCYLPHWKCDGDFDCKDLSDEKGCDSHNCTENQFQCSSGQCIEKRWVCDGDNDCKDASDERNCSLVQVKPHALDSDTLNCVFDAFRCTNATNSLCIPNSWVCDGERDCLDGEDEAEEKCQHSTCAPYMFRCPNGKCIFKSWVCDDENDCGDVESSDEKNCSSTTNNHSKLLPRPTTEKVDFSNSACMDWMFSCDNGNCLPYWWRCDGVGDCTDNSDEVGCAFTFNQPTTPATPEHHSVKCSKNQFTCSPGVCIPLSWVCDSMADCTDGSDERGCSRRRTRPTSCPVDAAPCADGRGCVRDRQLCDGVAHCADGSDEAHCITHTSTRPTNQSVADCPDGYLSCDEGTQCIPRIYVCNGHQDCYDESDELNCTSSNNDSSHVYQYLSIGVDQSSINSTSFLISCWMAQQKMVLYSFLPSIAMVSDGVWKNMTWTHDSVYRFKNLKPFTNYNVTFYIQDSKSNRTYASMKFVNTTTGEGVPSPPTNISVVQGIGSRLIVTWDAPAEPQGVVKYYTLYYAPPLPPIQINVPATGNKNITRTLKGYFKPNKNYSVWLTATNGAFVSQSTDVSYITFDEGGDVDELVNVSLSRPNDTAVHLEWHKIRGVEGYTVQIRLPPPYAMRAPVQTAANNITLTNLPPGLAFSIDVKPYKGGIMGDPFTIPIRTAGERDETLAMTAILLKGNGTSVQLKWSPPTGDRYKNKALEYEVHYINAIFRQMPGEFTNDTKHITNATSFLVDGLHACESYVFAVGILGGPLSKFIEIVTRANAKSPVKNLQGNYDEKNSKLQITWAANCDVLRFPLTYRLEITEETRNKKSMYALLPTTNVSLHHVFENVPVGGRYNICVYLEMPESAVSCVRVRSGAIPAPRGVVGWQSRRGHVMVSWQDAVPDRAEDNHKPKYQVIVSKNQIPDDLLKPTEDMTTMMADGSPLLIAMPDLAAGPLYVSVRTITYAGYYSDFSEVHNIMIDALEAEESSMAMSSIWWIPVLCVVGGLALGGVLVHVVLRQRRGSRLLRQHTPRYDNRRGQATLGDHDDDDVPPIQGFSDDEPLVIA